MKKEKIAKVLAHRGIGSRRGAEDLVKRGVVIVDGTIIDNLAQRIDPDATITIDGQPLPPQDSPRLWAFYKPAGCLTTRHDPEGRPTVYDYLPSSLQQAHYIGRLDYTTEGLLLLTNSPSLKKTWEDPKTGMIRRYRVRLWGHLTDADKGTLTRPMVIQGMRYQAFGIDVERKTPEHTWVSVTLTEGKNREIRRVFDHLGYPVTRLIRTEYGPYRLSDLSLKKGDVMGLTFVEADTAKTPSPPPRSHRGIHHQRNI
ncbi:MAG: pseudouridine synthase [Alphaproteobacteria bacterium]